MDFCAVCEYEVGCSLCEDCDGNHFSPKEGTHERTHESRGIPEDNRR